MPETVLGVFIIGEHEVQNADRIDILQAEVPNALLALVLYRKYNGFSEIDKNMGEKI